MTNTAYSIVDGPNYHKLFDSMVNGVTVFFKGFSDDTHRQCLFTVRITKLGIPLPGRNKPTWNITGIIIKKNGYDPIEFKKCTAYFYSHSRQGRFYEREEIEKYSYRYFDNLDDNKIREIIKSCRDDFPYELRSLEKYAETLTPRERLILEAMHTASLLNACSGVKIQHEIDTMLR